LRFLTELGQPDRRVILASPALELLHTTPSSTEVIESGDTAGVLDADLGKMPYVESSFYPIHLVSLTVDVPLHGGVQFYITVDVGLARPARQPW
jgi:hypothetical protein